MKGETIQSSLDALKSAGSVFGVILSQKNEVIYSDVPFSGDRVAHVVKVLDDIGFYFKKESRIVDQLAFGYDGGSLVIVIDEPYRIIICHSQQDEIDFIAKAAKSFLIDYQMGLFAAEFEKVLNQQGALETVSPEPKKITPEEVRAEEPHRPATQRITLKAEKGLNEAESLQPRMGGRAVLSSNQKRSSSPPSDRPGERP